LVFTGLADAQKNKVLSHSLFSRRAFNDISQHGNSLHCVFSIIIIPRDAVVLEECEKLVSIPFKAFYASRKLILHFLEIL